MRQAAMVVDPTGSKYTQSDLRALIQ